MSLNPPPTSDSPVSAVSGDPHTLCRSDSAFPTPESPDLSREEIWSLFLETPMDDSSITPSEDRQSISLGLQFRKSGIATSIPVFPDTEETVRSELSHTHIALGNRPHDRVNAHNDAAMSSQLQAASFGHGSPSSPHSWDKPSTVQSRWLPVPKSPKSISQYIYPFPPFQLKYSWSYN